MTQASTQFSPTNRASQSTDLAFARRQSLRSGSADAAQGFAQVMQAFSGESQSKVVEHAQSDETKASTEPAEPDAIEDQKQDESDSDAVAEQDSDAKDKAGASDDSESPKTTDDDQTVGGDPASSVVSQDDSSTDDRPGDVDSDPQSANIEHKAVAGPQTVQSPEQQSPDIKPDIEQAASLKLLQDQSDQAKLSIKGLVRSLTERSAPDLTTLAVQTRLGQDQAPSPEPVKGQTEQIQPLHTQHPSSASDQHTRDPSDAISTQPPQSPRTPGESASQSPGHNNPSIPVTQPNPRDGAQTQLRGAQRADVALAGSGSKPTSEHLRVDAFQRVVGNIQPARGEGVLTSRAVSGIESVGTGDPSRAGGALTSKIAQPSNAQAGQRGVIMAQVQRGLASLIKSGKGEMTLKLTPGHLGEIRIKLQSQGDRLSVDIRASREETRDLLSSGAKELASVLRDKGVQVDQIRVEHQNAPDGSAQQQGTHGGSSSGGDQSGNPRHGSAQHQNSDETGSHQEQAAASDDVRMDENRTLWTELGLDAIA